VAQAPNLNAMAKDNAGNILVGTSSGLLMYRLRDDYRQNAPVPRIDLLEVNGKPFDLEASNKLKHDENYIKIGLQDSGIKTPPPLTFLIDLKTSTMNGSQRKTGPLPILNYLQGSIYLN